MVYLKTTKNREKDYTFHEFFIGFHLNKLRSKIPNFMYVFGAFTCNEPGKGKPCWKDPDSDPNDFWAAIVPKSDYLIMEAVKPGLTLRQFLERRYLTREMVMQAYFQIVMALAVAYYELDFTHYDLHASNIVIQDIFQDKEYLVPYTFEGKTVYVRTYFLIKFIDYGISHVQINGEHYGNIPFANKGFAYWDRASPFTDIFRISGHILLEVLENRNARFLPDVVHIMSMFKKWDQFESADQLIDKLTNKRQSKFEYKPDSHGVFESDNRFTTHLNHVITNHKWVLKTIVYPADDLPDVPILNCVEECTKDIPAIITNDLPEIQTAPGKRIRVEN